MNEKLQQTINEELAKMPPRVANTINSFGWEKIVEEVGKNYLNTDEEINLLQVETLLILVGIEPLEFYSKNIENEVGTSKDEAEKIANEAFEKIFSPIAEKLEENIKSNLATKNITWKQNLDFIMSGGDYSVFITPSSMGRAEDSDHTKLVGSSNILETKDRLLN